MRKRSQIREVLILIIAMISMGCSTGNLYLVSDQEGAEVFLRAVGQSNSESIGKTPLQRPLDQVISNPDTAKGLVLEIKKEGFVDKQVYLPGLRISEDIEIRTQLQPLPVAQGVDSEGRDMRSPAAIQAELIKEQETKVARIYETNTIIDQVFEIKRLIHVGRREEATKRISSLKEEYPNLSVLYELQGGIAFLGKNYQQALDEYSVALKIHPENLQILNMKRYLEKLLGVEQRGQVQ